MVGEEEKVKRARRGMSDEMGVGIAMGERQEGGRRGCSTGKK